MKLKLHSSRFVFNDDDNHEWQVIFKPLKKEGTRRQEYEVSIHIDRVTIPVYKIRTTHFGNKTNAKYYIKKYADG